MQKLLIIQSGPSSKHARQIKTLFSESILNNERVQVYLIGEGVAWMNTELWDLIYNPNVTFYANAIDANRHGIPFSTDIIFSSKASLEQLKSGADRIIYINTN